MLGYVQEREKGLGQMKQEILLVQKCVEVRDLNDAESNRLQTAGFATADYCCCCHCHHCCCYCWESNHCVGRG